MMKTYTVTLWRYPSEDREPNKVDESVFYFKERAEGEQQALDQAKVKFKHSVYESDVEEEDNTESGPHGIYIFGDLHDTFSNELLADSAAHTIRATHPEWEIKVKKMKQGGMYNKGGLLNKLNKRYSLKDLFK